MNYNIMFKNIAFIIFTTLFIVGNTSIVLGESTMSAKKSFASKFAPLKETVIDKNSFFSMSKMTKDLLELFPLAKRSGEYSQELFDLYDIYTLVLSKKPEKSKELIKYGNEFLDKYKNSDIFTDEKLTWIHYRLTNAYQEEGDFPDGIKHQKLFVTYALKSKILASEKAALGQKEQLAYLLHQNEQYSEALKLNLQIEKEAKKAHVAEDGYFNLYNNISQNYYMLKKFSSARIYLNKRLALSEKYKNLEKELNTLFLLAVLAFEEDKFDESKKLFQKRIKLAKTKKNLLEYSTLKDMEDDLKTYHEKLDKKQNWSF